MSGLESEVSPRRAATGVAAHVLFVDDDESTRAGVAVFLQDEGFVVELASNGEDALRIARARRPDVVVTDYRMPGMDGVELCVRLRELDPDLPVILVTVFRDSDSLVLGMRAGAQDFLVKPLQPQAIVASVLEALHRRAKVNQRASQPSIEEPERLSSVQDQLARVANELRTVNEHLVESVARERAHAETEATERAQLDALLRNLSDGVIVADGDGRVRLVNAAARGVIGHDGPLESVDDVTSLAAARIDGAPLPTDQRPIVRAIRGEEFRDYEVLCVRRDGEIRRLVTSGTNVKGADGRVAIAIVVFRDVTELRRLERQRAEYAALISHDLRTPLSSIHLLAMTIRRGVAGSPAQIRATAERIQSNVARMDAMVQDILDASRLEARTMTLRCEPCELRGVIAGILSRLDDASARRVTVEGEQGRLVVRADAQRIERAITNLITNALKYSPEPTAVRVVLTRQGGDAVVRVVDRGEGIAREDLPRLFDRYYRAPGEGRVDGLGLGLYITRLLVEAHGGRIGVESTPGSGSTFTIALPLDATPA